MSTLPVLSERVQLPPEHCPPAVMHAWQASEGPPDDVPLPVPDMKVLVVLVFGLPPCPLEPVEPVDANDDEVPLPLAHEAPANAAHRETTSKTAHIVRFCMSSPLIR
jgi:hypothetical protein